MQLTIGLAAAWPLSPFGPSQPSPRSAGLVLEGGGMRGAVNGGALQVGWLGGWQVADVPG